MRTALIALAASVLLSGLAFGAPVGEPPPDFSGLTVLELLGKLRDTDPRNGASAADELAKRARADEKVIGPIEAVTKDPNPQTRRYALQALAFTGSPKAVTPLIAALKDRDATVRAAVGESIFASGLKDERLVAPLVAALKDGDLWVRSCAALALGSIGSPRAAVPLVAAAKDAERQVRASAIRALGQIGGDPAKAALIDLLGHADPPTTYHAAIALAELRDPRAVPRLITALNEPDRRARVEAAARLGDLGDARASDALAAAAKSDDPRLRDTAARALGRLGAAGGSGSEVDPQVRQKLDQPISFEFQGIALEEALRFCADYSGASIQVRWDALQAAGVERSAKVTLNLKSVPLGGALRLILRSVAGKEKLDFAVKDGVILVSTAADLEQARPSASP